MLSKIREVMPPAAPAPAPEVRRTLSSVTAAVTSTYLADALSWDEYTGGSSGLQSDVMPLGLAGILTDKVMVDEKASGRVPVMACTDEDTLFTQVWGMLEAIPEILQTRSASVIPLLLAFIAGQYQAVYGQDSQISALGIASHVGSEEMVGVILTPHDGSTSGLVTGSEGIIPSPKSVRSRLVAVLKVMSCCAGPKRLHKHQVLYSIYNALIVRPDTALSKLCLQCMFTYKQPHLVTYKEELLGLMEDGKMRDQLLNFSISSQGPAIASEADASGSSTTSSSAKTTPVQAAHRPLLLPVLIRLLFGRLLAKSGTGTGSGKSSPGSRRAAILSFLSKLSPDELGEFGLAMVRCFLPQNQESYDLLSLPAAEALEAVQSVSIHDIARVSTGKTVGFLRLCGDVAKHLGYKALPLARHLMHLLLLLLQHAQNVEGPSAIAAIGGATTSYGVNELDEHQVMESSEFKDEEEAAADVPAEGNSTRGWEGRAGFLRGLTLAALTDIMTQFADAIDFRPYSDQLWSALSESIARLPASSIGATRPSALLELCKALSEHPELTVLLKGSQATPAVLKCLSAGAEAGKGAGPAVMNVVLSFIENLSDAESDQGGPSTQVLLSHIPLLIESFTARFGAPEASLSVSASIAAATGGSRGKAHAVFTERQLTILCRISQLAREGAVKLKPSVITKLATLLLPFLRPEKKVNDRMKIHVLGVYRSFSSSLESSAVRAHWGFLSKLLGPHGGLPGMTDAMCRTELLKSITALAKHQCLSDDSRSQKALEHSVGLLGKLHARDEAAIEELDFSSIVSAFNSLSDGDGWERVLSGTDVSAAALPLVYHCLQTLHSDELALRGAATAALSALAQTCAAADGNAPASHVMKAVLVPGLRSGMTCHHAVTRKGFLLTLAALVAAFPQETSTITTVPSDLGCLSRDDKEADFFYNLCHLQLHRRVRALAAIRKQIEKIEEEERKGACPFSVSTLVHYLLPLALHPLHECDKASQALFVAEAQATIGAIGRHLNWSSYFSTLRSLMQQLTKNADKEKALIGAMCSLLDAFHFQVTPPADLEEAADEADKADESKQQPDQEDEPEQPMEPAFGAGKGDAVWRALTGKILPGLRALLTKEETTKAGAKEKVLRPPVAIALLKVLKFMPGEMFIMQLEPLLLAVCNTLKSRDSGVRDAARSTLATMSNDLGPDYLKYIIDQLCTALKGGYQLNVRTFTLHSLLLSISGSGYAPPQVPSIDADAVIQKRKKRSGNQLSSGNVPSSNGTDDEDTPAPLEYIAVKSMEDMPADDAQEREAVVKPSMDACLPKIIELLIEDLVGSGSAAKDSDHNVASTKIKEAKGSKVYACFELLGKMILFRPTYSVLSPEVPDAVSSIHAIVTPVLLELHECQSSKRTSRCNTALARLAIGLSSNPSCSTSELLLYIHATVAPFLLPKTWQEDESDSSDSDSDIDSDLEEMAIIHAGNINKVSRIGGAADAAKRKGKKRVRSRQWIVGQKDELPPDAFGLKKKKWENAQVLDGSKTPKLTGANRYDAPASKAADSNGSDLSDPAALAATTFGLKLLTSYLKKGLLDSSAEEARSMADPYVPLLAKCLTKNAYNAVVTLALRSLGYLLSWNLPSMAEYGPSIGRSILKLLVRESGGGGGGKGAGSVGEMVQGCFKALGLLFKQQVELFPIKDGSLAVSEAIRKTQGKDKERDKEKGQDNQDNQAHEIVSVRHFGLEPRQMRALLSLLHEAVVQPDHQHATFTLIRAIVSRKVMLPEVYDLMEQLCKLAVVSHYAPIRASCSSAYLTFLVEYPLGEKRLRQNINQVLAGVEYQYEEGRLAAIEMMEKLLQQLPVPLLDERANMLFVTLCMRLVNDTSVKCRAAVATALVSMLRRVSGEVFATLADYVLKWFQTGLGQDGDDSSGGDPASTSPEQRALYRTAAQVSGLLSQARPDLLKRGSTLGSILSALMAGIPTDTVNAQVVSVEEDDTDKADSVVEPWELVHQALVSLEKLITSLPGACDAIIASNLSLLDGVCACLLYPHAWVRLAAARVWGVYLSRRNVKTCSSVLTKEGEWFSNEGALFKLCHNTCAQMDHSAANKQLLDQAVKNLVWIVQAMHHGPDLCVSMTKGAAAEDLPEERKDQAQDPLVWIFHRMSYIGRGKGELRRSSVFRWFAASCQLLPQQVVLRFLPHMLTPLQRCVLDEEHGGIGHDVTAAETSMTAAQLAVEVMDMLEEKAGPSGYLEALTKVNESLAKKREKRLEAIALRDQLDPEGAAKRKIEKGKAKTQQRKRKAERNSRFQVGYIHIHITDRSCST
ncbi:unnamed protein product [Chrysoparadoxa australica]